jgi:hypothetical protein
MFVTCNETGIGQVDKACYFAAMTNRGIFGWKPVIIYELNIRKKFQVPVDGNYSAVKHYRTNTAKEVADTRCMEW